MGREGAGTLALAKFCSPYYRFPFIQSSGSNWSWPLGCERSRRSSHGPPARAESQGRPSRRSQVQKAFWRSALGRSPDRYQEGGIRSWSWRRFIVPRSDAYLERNLTNFFHCRRLGTAMRRPRSCIGSRHLGHLGLTVLFVVSGVGCLWVLGSRPFAVVLHDKHANV